MDVSSLDSDFDVGGAEARSLMLDSSANVDIGE